MDDLSALKEVICAFCNANTDFTPAQKVAKQDECPKCGKDIRCCMHCYFYDKSSYNECREINAERIVDKEKANYCDYFVLSGAKRGGPSKDDLLSAADSLFKK